MSTEHLKATYSHLGIGVLSTMVFVHFLSSLTGSWQYSTIKKGNISFLIIFLSGTFMYYYPHSGVLR